MTSTILLTIDPLWHILLGVLGLGWLYLGYRVVLILERWVELYGQRKEPAPVFWPSSPTQGTSGQVSQAAQEIRRPTASSVPDVSPELILKRAPKPAGFGGPGNGNKQPEPPSDPEGGDDEKGDTVPSTCSPGKV